MEGSKIEENILYPLVGSYSPFDLSPYKGRHYVDHLLERVRKHVKEQGDGPWLTNGVKKVTGESKAFGEATHSMSEAEPRSQQIARILHHKFGVGKGDVVHFVVPSNAEMYFPIIGTWLLRGVVSPADPGLSVEVLVAQMEEANTKVVFCCLATLGKMEKVKDRLGRDISLIVMDGASDEERSLDYLRREDDMADRPSLPHQESTEENSFLAICWSSGTTGQPKGIMLGENVFLRLFKESGPASLMTTCFFHLGGFMNPLNALGHGQELIFIAPEDLEDNIGIIMKVASESSANMFACGSHHLIQLASWDMPPDQKPAESIQIICPLGTNVYEGIFSDLKSKFPSAFTVLDVYGQSEGGIAVAVGFDQKTLGGTRAKAVKIIDPDTGVAVGPNVVGEITYKSDYPMLGYLNHPEENERFFGKDGFLHSGDLGHYDEAGNLYFDGRLKELIKYKNFHLYPNELEELLMAHEGVEDAAVFGKPEPTVQELVTACVVKKEGAEVAANDLQMLVDEKVDEHKKLRGGVHFVEKIPRNPQGKILRKNLASLLG